MKHLPRLLCALLLLWGGIAIADPLTTPFSAHYDVALGNGFKIGEMDRSLERQADGSYLFTSKVYTVGLVSLFKKDTFTERSHFRLDGDHIIALEYTGHYTGRDKNTLERMRFDWATDTAESLRNGKTTSLKIQAGVLDKLNNQLAMRRDLAAGKRDLHYPTADRGVIEDYHFKVVGEETLETAVGKLKVLKLVRLPYSKKRKTTFWCAPTLDYMVVRLEQLENDSTIVSTIRSRKP